MALSSIRTRQELYKSFAFLNISLGNRPLKMIRQFDSSGLCSDCEVIFLQWFLHGSALPKGRWNRQRRRKQERERRSGHLLQTLRQFTC